MEKEKENNEGKCMVSNAVYLCKGYQIKNGLLSFLMLNEKLKFSYN